jgi:hypothetical protein
MHIAYLTDNINKVARQSKEAKDRRRSGAPGRVESWKKNWGQTFKIQFTNSKPLLGDSWLKRTPEHAKRL